MRSCAARVQPALANPATTAHKRAMKKKPALPPPFAAPTKDARFAGTFEVFVPAPDRAKPHRVPLQFPTHEKAEAWIHSPEGREAIAALLGGKGA